VCLVSCQRSPEPVFLKWKEMETRPDGDFYVRSGPGSVRLTPESAAEYIRTRFPAMSKPPETSKSTRLKLTPDELTKLSKIVIIEESNPALEAVQRATSVEHGLAEVRDSVFFDLPIRHAYIITSRRDQPPSQPVQQPGGSAARS